MRRVEELSDHEEQMIQERADRSKTPVADLRRKYLQLRADWQEPEDTAGAAEARQALEALGINVMALRAHCQKGRNRMTLGRYVERSLGEIEAELQRWQELVKNLRARTNALSEIDPEEDPERALAAATELSGIIGAFRDHSRRTLPSFAQSYHTNLQAIGMHIRLREEEAERERQAAAAQERRAAEFRAQEELEEQVKVYRREGATEEDARLRAMRELMPNAVRVYGTKQIIVTRRPE